MTATSIDESPNMTFWLDLGDRLVRARRALTTMAENAATLNDILPAQGTHRPEQDESTRLAAKREAINDAYMLWSSLNNLLIAATEPTDGPIPAPTDEPEQDIYQAAFGKFSILLNKALTTGVTLSTEGLTDGEIHPVSIKGNIEGIKLAMSYLDDYHVIN